MDNTHERMDQEPTQLAPAEPPRRRRRITANGSNWKRGVPNHRNGVTATPPTKRKAKRRAAGKTARASRKANR